MKSINQMDLKGKRVLCRFDFNVPIDEKCDITDDRRIRAALPTINYILDEHSKIVIASHLGRPEGKVVEDLSLAPVADRLSHLLGRKVVLAKDCVGKDVEDLVDGMRPNDIVMLENLRFHNEETENSDEFARKLASYADVYIDDAFGNAHRKHASNVGIIKFVKECGIGLLMKRELSYFEKALENPARPLVAIIGGSKVYGKLDALVNLVKKVDKMIIGGRMAFAFLESMGNYVGDSSVEKEFVDTAGKIIEAAVKMGVKLYLPVDCVVAESMDEKAATKVVTVQEIDSGWTGMDIGPATIRLFSEVLDNARTIVWNGPMGVFEMEAFSKGTFAMARRVVDSHALTVVGGGDTDVAINRTGESDNISYISTGGGAFLELLEGKKLPAVEVLKSHK
jgi:phosphoglycerate kinase